MRARHVALTLTLSDGAYLWRVVRVPEPQQPARRVRCGDVRPRERRLLQHQTYLRLEEIV